MRMNQIRPRSSRMLAATTLAIIGAVGMTVSSSYSVTATSQASPWRGRAQEQAARVKMEKVRRVNGLHAAARAADFQHYVSFVDLEAEFAAANFEALTDASDLVIRGLFKNNKTRLARGEGRLETILTDHVVQVLEVRKGDGRLSGKDIRLTIPGGQFQFPDSSLAEILTPGLRKPLPQEEFWLFLRQSEEQTAGGHQAFELAWANQALFKMEPDGKIRPGANVVLPVSIQAIEAGQSGFAALVEEAIEKNRLMYERQVR